MIVGFIGKMGSGKTLSMTRELLKYKSRGYRIISNYGLSFPHEKLDFGDLFLMAEEQTPLGNVVIALDEVHILLDSRSGMSNTNKVVSFWLNQTRKMKVALFYTTQHAHQIDKRLRANTNIFVFCEGLHVTKGGRRYFICYNELTDGDYFKRDIFVGDPYFRYYNTDEVIAFIDRKELNKRMKQQREQRA